MHQPPSLLPASRRSKPGLRGSLGSCRHSTSSHSPGGGVSPHVTPTSAVTAPTAKQRGNGQGQHRAGAEAVKYCIAKRRNCARLWPALGCEQRRKCTAANSEVLQGGKGQQKAYSGPQGAESQACRAEEPPPPN